MSIAYLTSAMTHGDDGTGNNDWAEFERLFPDANAWLQQRGLERNLLHLRRLKSRPTYMNQFEINRLAELETLFAGFRERGTPTIVFPPLTSLEDIVAAVLIGKVVHWKNKGYRVTFDKLGQWHIIHDPEGSAIGLTWADGRTLNGKIEEFYVA